MTSSHRFYAKAKDAVWHKTGKYNPLNDVLYVINSLSQVITSFCDYIFSQGIKVHNDVVQVLGYSDIPVLVFPYDVSLSIR